MDLDRRAFATLLLAAAAVYLVPAVAHASKPPQRPAAEAFGPGPRPSEQFVYSATLLPSAPLRLRQLQTVPVFIADARGQPVEDAVIRIDGGMPEHSHGLPTQPRVARYLGGGVYEIEGLRFSMGGWWELKLSIMSAAGADQVTFHLDF